MKMTWIMILLFWSGASWGANYSIDWFTMDNGGGKSTGGAFSLHGTTGQPDTSVLTGGDYVLAGGVWSDWIPCYLDLPDLERFLIDWLLNESQVGYKLNADLNNDGAVNLKDFGVFTAAWLHYCPDTWTDR